jgi:hypothetical protein
MYLVLPAFTSSPISLLTTTKATQQHVITIHIPRQIIYCAYNLVAACTYTARSKGNTIPTGDHLMEQFCGHKHNTHHPQKKTLVVLHRLLIFSINCDLSNMLDGHLFD